MAPGDLVPTWGGDGHARYAVVLATSRHKRTYAKEAAYHDLSIAYSSEGDVLDMTAEVRWYRHTRRMIGCLLGSECEPGTWCEDGEGRAWVAVLAGTPLGGEG